MKTTYRIAARPPATLGAPRSCQASDFALPGATASFTFERCPLRRTLPIPQDRPPRKGPCHPATSLPRPLHLLQPQCPLLACGDLFLLLASLLCPAGSLPAGNRPGLSQLTASSLVWVLAASYPADHCFFVPPVAGPVAVCQPLDRRNSRAPTPCAEDTNFPTIMSIKHSSRP